MKISIRTPMVTFAIAAFTAVAWISGCGGGLGAAPAKKTWSSSLEEQMAEMMKGAAAGGAREALKPLEGSWRTVQKTWLEPGQPTITEGTSEHKLVSNGRFLEQRTRGVLMNQPIERYGLTGYDSKKTAYVTLWADDHAKVIETFEGTVDTAAHEITMQGKGKGPDGKDAELKVVTRWIDDGRHVVSIYGIRNGAEELVMETTYRRIAPR